MAGSSTSDKMLEPAASAPSRALITNPLMISGFVCFSVLAYIYFPESIDDAYITLRYARNLFEGHGLVFNIGERVEGFSNFTWLSVLAAVGWSGLSMPMAMKVLSFLSGLIYPFPDRPAWAAMFRSRLGWSAAGAAACIVVVFCIVVGRWTRNRVLHDVAHHSAGPAMHRSSIGPHDRTGGRGGLDFAAGGADVLGDRGRSCAGFARVARGV